MQTPPAPTCKDQSYLGDLLRNFTSPTEKALADISQKLDAIYNQIEQLRKDVEELKNKVDHVAYDIAVNKINPGAVKQGMQTFAEVAQNCSASQQSNYCANELGDNTPQHPGALRNQIRTAILDSGVLKDMPDLVSGDSRESVLKLWDNVVVDLGPFFTNTRSKQLQAGVQYFVDLELSALTLAVNYYRWETAPEDTVVVPKINTFQNAVQAQMARFKPTPGGTTVDMRTGLMWSTSNKCLANSLQSPGVCGISQVGGIPLIVSCGGTDQFACNAPLPVPLVGGDPNYFAYIIGAFKDTAPQSSWKVPSPDQVRRLLVDMGSDGVEYLKKNAEIDLSAPNYWTSTMWCGGYDHNPFTQVTTCLDRSGGDARAAPLRVSFNMNTGRDSDVTANGCNNGPCRGGYFFVRQLSDDEYQAYGIPKKRP